MNSLIKLGLVQGHELVNEMNQILDAYTIFGDLIHREFLTWDADFIISNRDPNQSPSWNLKSTPIPNENAYIAPNGVLEAWTMDVGASGINQENIPIPADGNAYLYTHYVKPLTGDDEFRVGVFGVNGVAQEAIIFDFATETVVSGNQNNWAIIKLLGGSYDGWWLFAIKSANNGSGTILVDRLDAPSKGQCAHWQRRIHILDNPDWYQVSQLHRLWASPAQAEAIDNRRNRIITCWGDSFVNSPIAPNGKDTWPAVVSRSFGFVRNYDDSNGGAATGVGGNNSTDIKNRFLSMTQTMRDSRLHIIWAGQNNKSQPETVKADIAEMVSSFNHDEYLILGMLNTASDDVALRAVSAQLNSDLSSLYGQRFIDLMPSLLAAYDDQDAQDVIDMSNDTVPSSLRSDAVHLNADGQQVVGTDVVTRLNALQWWDNLYEYA